ncbi:hypothetical protein [Azospirillum canadense]|uniref:hypothetical protein n=1 Tax=Azospirillum canadense TaxID=403962 RepID=UPI002226F2CE|nr:hypothetical protein [Azospirillum canadense]MCW2239912.1 uncharacterized protein YceK [Azospirillum canadense]
MLRLSLPAALFAVAMVLSGCGVVVATVDTAASVAGSAVSVAGDVVSATAHVATSPFRGGDDEKDSKPAE